MEIVVIYEGPIISRGDAKAKGLKRYFNGPEEHCIRGHIDERSVGSKKCCRCHLEDGRRRYHEDLENQRRKKRTKATARRRAKGVGPRVLPTLEEQKKTRIAKEKRARVLRSEKRKTDPEYCALLRGRDRKSAAKRKEENPEKTKQKAHESYVKAQERNIRTSRERYWADPEAQRENKKRYAKENPEKVLEHAAARKRRIKRATPPWIGIYKDVMRAIYGERIRLTRETGVVHHVDHIHPLRGDTAWGLHVPWNLQVLPGSDNIAKSNKMIILEAMGPDANPGYPICLVLKS